MPRFAEFAGWPAAGTRRRLGRAGCRSFLVPFGMIAVLFYFLMIRPERRKKAELLEMLQNLKKNDRVVTIGGIYGTVVATSKDGEEVTLRGRRKHEHEVEVAAQRDRSQSCTGAPSGGDSAKAIPE